jgi:hypothetical protein
MSFNLFLLAPFRIRSFLRRIRPATTAFMTEKDRNTTLNTAFVSGKRSKARLHIGFSWHRERNVVSLTKLRQIIKTLRDLENETVLSLIIAGGFSMVVTLYVYLNCHCMIKVRSGEKWSIPSGNLHLYLPNIPYQELRLLGIITDPEVFFSAKSV